MKIKALFVGLGSIGQRHLRNIKAIEGDNVECIAYRSKRLTPMLTDDMQVVHDGSLRETYGLKEYDNFDQCLEEKPDIAFITNPSSMHVEYAIKCASHGCAMFIEKPLSSSLDGVSELRTLCENKSIISFVGFQLRFDNSLRMLKNYIDEKIIGNIISAEIHQAEYLPNWHPYEDYSTSYASRKELGGGVILTQIHEIDYTLWLFGKPVSVYCVGSKRSKLNVAVEDTASILLKYKENKTYYPVNINLDYLQRPPRRGCIIVGDNGKIEWDFHANSIIFHNSNGEIIQHTFPQRKRNDLFMKEMVHFLDCYKMGKQTMIPVTVGEDRLRIALAALESLETGKPVDIIV